MLIKTMMVKKLNVKLYYLANSATHKQLSRPGVSKLCAAVLWGAAGSNERRRESVFYHYPKGLIICGYPYSNNILTTRIVGSECLVLRRHFNVNSLMRNGIHDHFRITRRNCFFLQQERHADFLLKLAYLCDISI